MNEHRGLGVVSGRGGAVLLGSVVLFGSGLALGYPELCILGAAGLLTLALALAFLLHRPALEVTRHVQPARVAVGEPALALLGVHNRSRGPSTGFVATDHFGATEVEVAVPITPGGGTSFVHYAVPTDRRGRFVTGPVSVARSDPFGLVRRAEDHGGEGVVWVHPRTHRLAPFPSGVVVDVEGPLSEMAPRGTITFSSLREYVIGDDLRQVHWRSTARTGTLMVREHVDTSQPRVTVALDTEAAVWTPELFEAGVEVAASIVRAAERQSHPVALAIGGERHTGVERAGTTALFDRLAQVQPGGDHAGEDVYRLCERAGRGGALVMVTGPASSATVARLAGVRRRFTPVIVVTLVEGSVARSSRRSGMVFIEAGTAARVAAAWNQLVGA